MVTRCAAALSVHPVAATATGEVAGAVLEALGPGPDLVLLFAATAHTGAMADIVSAIRSILGPAVLVGSTAATVAGGGQEIEDEPALSLLAVHFGPDNPPPMPVRLDAIPDEAGGATIRGVPRDLPDAGSLVLLSDPFTFPVSPLLDSLASSHPGLTVLGGMASSARAAGGNRLVLDGTLHHDGAVGVVLPPGVATTAVVSQGCRPIGQPMTVTGANGTMIESLASEPALPLLLRLIDSLEPEERALAARGLHLGVVVDDRRDTFGPGDFLIRNVLGAVRDRQAVAVGDQVDIGATVQFQVRDAGSADAELRALLADRAGAGAVLFTCNGRGSHLFGVPHHDAELVAEAVGGAAAGMSCAGEIGPIGGRSHIHGFTASVLLFDG